jgi:hypothetical protein
MEPFLAFVTHDVATNTLEAAWKKQLFDENNEPTELVFTKRRNYSAPQKAEFETDCGVGSDKYTLMAGW